MELLAEGLTGGFGGLVGRSVAFPFDTLKVKLATAKEGSGFAEVLRRTLLDEGVAGVYRGLPFSAAEAMFQKFLYVLFYATLKLLNSQDGKMSAARCVLCGYLSDLTCIPFTVPVEAMVVRLQSAPPGASQIAIIRDALFTRSGFLAALKTGRAYFVLSLKPGIEFAIFDQLKRRILEARQAGGADGADSSGQQLSALCLEPGVAFAVGALSRAVATMVVYPYARGKALAQAQLAPTAFEAVRRVLRTEGVLAMYRGLSMELMRGVTQAAVMFAVMERVRSFVRRCVLTPPPQAPPQALPPPAGFPKAAGSNGKVAAQPAAA